MKINRFIIVLLTISLSLAITGCNYDKYDGKRPFDYGEAKWVCSDPNAWFYVHPDAEDYHTPTGELTLDDKVIDFKLTFPPETDLVTITAETNGNSKGFTLTTSGKCTFSPNEFTITIDKQGDEIFEGKCDRLVFVKENT